MYDPEIYAAVKKQQWIYELILVKALELTIERENINLDHYDINSLDDIVVTKQTFLEVAKQINDQHQNI